MLIAIEIKTSVLFVGMKINWKKTFCDCCGFVICRNNRRGCAGEHRQTGDFGKDSLMGNS